MCDWRVCLVACVAPPPRSSLGFPAPAAVIPRLGCRRRDPESGQTSNQFTQTGIAAGLRGCPCEFKPEYYLGWILRLSLSPPPVLLMSDFKLGIVRLGRVAGKVSWISGLPCAAGEGPAGTTKGDGKIGFTVIGWCLSTSLMVIKQLPLRE